MRAIALSLLFALTLSAGPTPPVIAVLTELASALGDSNSVKAISVFSKSLPGYESLTANLAALVTQNDISCSIEVRTESGDERTRQTEVDWYMVIKSMQENGPTERRQQKVKLTLARQDGTWKIISIDPIAILDLPKL